MTKTFVVGLCDLKRCKLKSLDLQSIDNKRKYKLVLEEKDVIECRTTNNFTSRMVTVRGPPTRKTCRLGRVTDTLRGRPVSRTRLGRERTTGAPVETRRHGPRLGSPVRAPDSVGHSAATDCLPLGEPSIREGLFGGGLFCGTPGPYSFPFPLFLV